MIRCQCQVMPPSRSGMNWLEDTSMQTDSVSTLCSGAQWISFINAQRREEKEINARNNQHLWWVLRSVRGLHTVTHTIPQTWSVHLLVASIQKKFHQDSSKASLLIWVMSKYVTGHLHLEQSKWHFRCDLILAPKTCTPKLAKCCPLHFKVHIFIICDSPYRSGSKCLGTPIPLMAWRYVPKFMMTG